MLRPCALLHHPVKALTVEPEKFPGDYSGHEGSGTMALPQGVKKGGMQGRDSG